MSPLSRLLVQVTGPAHVAVNDSRWEQLLHCYDQLVHLEYQWKGDNVLATCAKNMGRHAGTSSNLAALTLHVSRMLQDLTVSVCIHLEQSEQISSPEPSPSAPATTVAAVATQAFSNRIALVGKARASCGGLNLLRILIHELISSAYNSSTQTDQNDDDDFDDTKLEDAFLYRSRETYQQASKHSPKEKDVTMDLISSLLTFVASMGGSADGGNPSGISAHHTALIMETIPELYDATVQSLQLILVLLSTQLYQPLISSTQQKMEMPKGKKIHTNYFLDKIMSHGENRQRRQRERRQRKHQKASDMKVQNHHDTHGGLENFREISSKPGEPLDDLYDWSPQSVLKACLAWLIQRPHSPPRSISYHHAELAQSVVQARNERIGPDGMYEHYAIVMAENSAAHAENSKSSSRHGGVIASFRKKGHGEALRQVRAGLSRQSAAHGAAAATVHGHGGHGLIQGRSPAKLILDATKGVLVLSSTLILFPFRLMSLALGLWGNRHHHYHIADGHDKAAQARLLELSGPSDRTNNVLWLSDSPIADLGSTLFLILLNNHRAARGGSNENNPFRLEISSLDDNRWEGPEKTISTNKMRTPPDVLAHDNVNGNGVLDSGIVNGDHVLEFAPSTESMSLLDQHTVVSAPVPRHMILSVNFESLFESFGYIVHTEVGSLVLYSLLQSSPIFAASVAVRSDLDTLVLPLLRTLYYSSVVTQYHHPASYKQSTPNDLSRSCPFRSPSQLYLILILLLLFSQDASFGPDAFRRVTIPSLPWYKERKLKDINLGSVLILSLLRALTFNLSRLRDGFLLSNCCAVLLNLSPHMVNINEYTAMRLGSITMSLMRKYAVLLARDGGTEPDEGDVSTVTGMYGEVRIAIVFIHLVVGLAIAPNMRDAKDDSFIIVDLA
jgi:hypothetical protein